jgi:hypothetical protein
MILNKLINKNFLNISNLTRMSSDFASISIIKNYMCINVIINNLKL